MYSNVFQGWDMTGELYKTNCTTLSIGNNLWMYEVSYYINTTSISRELQISERSYSSRVTTARKKCNLTIISKTRMFCLSLWFLWFNLGAIGLRHIAFCFYSRIQMNSRKLELFANSSLFSYKKSLVNNNVL